VLLALPVTAFTATNAGVGVVHATLKGDSLVYPLDASDNASSAVSGLCRRR
jgi:hypothetical protein